jgi:MFS family permease
MPDATTTRIAGQEHKKSLVGLDWINFFMADVTTGVGPFLAIYLTATRHWDPARVGTVVAIQSIASVAAQAPAGWLVDWSKHKKWLVICGAVLVAFGCLGIVWSGNVATQAVTQVLIGAAAALFPPAIAAISLGIVGTDRLPKRIGRNESFNHAGNVFFALLAGIIGTLWGQQWIFYTSSAIAVGTIWAASLIRPEDIDNDAARAAESKSPDSSESGRAVVSVRQLFRNRLLWIFTISVVLFHFANAAMLPLVGELLSKGKPKESSFLMSACIIGAQCVMIPVAWATGKFSQSWGRKPIFLIGFSVLTVRGLLYTLSGNAFYLLAIQCLDGVGAAIFGVLGVIIIADLAKGTGRFNLMQGLIQAALGTGAFLSNLLSGYVVNSWGYRSSFLLLAGIAFSGLLFFAILMPETRCYNRS